jgi:hypothetical protein
MRVLLLPHATPDHVGLIPSFLDENDPRPAAQQFDENYAFGGGWKPMPGFKLSGTTLKYPGDPAMNPLAMIVFRQETILIYECAWVVILQVDGSWEASRMD